MSVRIGKQAPDFTATAFFQGGVEEITLSAHRGKWALLFFYPGDFTSV